MKPGGMLEDFMWQFSVIESHVDAIFSELFNLSATASLLFHNNVDLRKKIMFIDLGFKHQGMDQSKILKRVHELASIRNVIAHSCFDLGEDGIDFDYVNQRGELKPPDSRKVRLELGWEL